MTTKNAIRQLMRLKRGELPPDEMAAYGLAAQHNILASSHWQDAKTVALYMAAHGETPTNMLLEDAWNRGKNVYLPKILDLHAGLMAFFEVRGPGDLKPGPFGLLEPDAGNVSANFDLVIAPGVAFDMHGYRLGYGGGFYDRFFQKNPVSSKIGLCYSFQIVAELPHDTLDARLNAICDEKGLKWL